MDKEKFNKYAKLKLEQKSIDAQIKALGPEILEEMRAAGADKAQSQYGTFSVETRKYYTYSSKVKELAAQMEDLQANEKASGVATANEVKQLKFFAKKNENSS